MITIVDYGMWNLGSMLNMFKRIDVKASIESDPEIIQHSDKLVLPGVGAFDSAMTCINGVSGLREILDHKALVERVPILGVCLGMQLLTSSSEEGSIPGLSWIAGTTFRFPKQKRLKVPHMGWNVARPNFPSNLTAHIEDDPRYYFVHSFCVQVHDRSHSLMQTDYGITFDSAIGHENIYGVQFHPEKSHRYGKQILKNFSEL